MNWRALAAVLLVAATAPANSADKPASALQTASAGNMAFALDLYQQLRTREGNLFFSPLSLSTTLAMTYAGARGQTASEMAHALHFTLPQAELPAAFGALKQEVSRIGKRNQVTLILANSLWCQRGNSLTEPFLDVNRKHFGAEIGLADFIEPAQREPARLQINAWAAKVTNGRINSVVTPNQLNELTRLVLCNAIYFKGDWAEQFDPRATKPMDFFVAPGRNVKVPTMFREMYVKSLSLFSDVKALELRYRNGDLSMVVLLPSAVDGLGKLESRLTPQRLSKLLGDLDGFVDIRTMVYLPKFRLSAQLNLKDALARLGMPSAFELSTADLSGITGKRNLFISEVTHQAEVEVNEQGTEAAAATASFHERSGSEMFRVDHPFFFLIREHRTGCILFLGRVVDPTSQLTP